MTAPDCSDSPACRDSGCADCERSYGPRRDIFTGCRTTNWWTPKRLARHGWAVYPVPPTSTGRFVENLDAIVQTIGDICYEVLAVGDIFYIRRV